MPAITRSSSEDALIIQQGMKVALEKAARKMFIDMQANYPDYADQTPKSSAFLRLGGNKIEVGFDHPKVIELDGGKEGFPIVGRYRQRVKSHARKLKSGRTIQVKDQTRVYNGYKPMKTRQGSWYIANKTPSTGGNKFFTKAYENNFLGDAFNEILKKAIVEESLKK